MTFDSSGLHRAPMSKIRKRIAETLVRAQQTAAILTTFNEVDLTEVINLRSRLKEQFEKTHGVSLGLMSFFSRATTVAIKHFPVINAEIDGDDVVYHEHVNLGIAVNTERGLVVPVLRNVDRLSLGDGCEARLLVRSLHAGVRLRDTERFVLGLVARRVRDQPHRRHRL